MVEFTEKNFYIACAIFAVIWGISVQFPFIVENEVEIPEMIHVDAFAKIADLEGWNEWNSVYKINTTDTRIDTGTVLDFFLSFKTHISLLFFSFLVSRFFFVLLRFVRFCDVVLFSFAR